MRVTAQQGDTADLLCFRHLGRTGGVTEQVLEMNPGLSALGPILPAWTVVELPDQAAAAPRKNDLLQLWD